MANKSINMTLVRRIIQLRAEGLSKLKIDESLHIHRAIFDNYLFKLAARGKDIPELLECSDEQLASFVYTYSFIPKADNHIEDLQKHMDYIKAELTRTGATN